MEIVMNKLTTTELENIYPLGENKTGKPIFIDFYADWWGPCRVFEQVLNDVVPKYEDKIQMYKVNIEDEPQLAQQFGARSIPFMVMVSSNGDKQSHPGSMTADQLQYFFEGLILKK